MAALLNAVSLLRGDMAALTRSNARIEAGHKELHQRLDTIEAAQAELANVAPFLQDHFGKTVDGNEATAATLDAIAAALSAVARESKANHEQAVAARETILARLTEATGAITVPMEASVLPTLELIVHRLAANAASTLDGIASVKQEIGGIADIGEKLLRDGKVAREQALADLKSTGAMIAFTRAAVLGDHAPLPVSVEDHPMMERYILHQRPDLTSGERPLVEWRGAIAGMDATDLIALLKKQQTPSPTDTPETRLLRYRLAAITRAEIEQHGVVPPARPITTRATDRSAATGFERSQELADLWRAGESAALYAEPELAGTVDVFDALETSLALSESDPAPAELKELHRKLAKRIGLGERPKLEESRANAHHDHGIALEPSKDR
jgi:hypothetical protein